MRLSVRGTSLYVFRDIQPSNATLLLDIHNQTRDYDELTTSRVLLVANAKCSKVYERKLFALGAKV